MKVPLDKNRSWIAHLQDGIDQLDEAQKLVVMRPAGKACASDLLSLCEKYLKKRATSVEELVIGWNILRAERNLTGRWEFEGTVVRGTFGECGCPLVRSGLIELHPVQCYCSQGLMETIFSEAAKKAVEVKIKRTIGRGDDVCEFIISL